MSRAYRSIIRLTPVMLSLVLSGCSWLNWFSDDKSGQQQKSTPVQSKEWRFSQNWPLTNIPESASHFLGESIELRGYCEMSPKLLRIITNRQQRGLLLPLLRADNQQTLAPDLEASARLYKTLDHSLKLEPAVASLDFFQTLLASVEHACPENATREIDSCVMKGWMSLGGLLKNNSLYDWNRLGQWMKSHSSTGYLLMSSADLYNSSAVLHTRYSRYGRVLTEADTAVRKAVIKPHVGHLRMDWVSADFVDRKKFVSHGYCQLDWTGKGRDLSAARRQDVAEALRPEFEQFMKKAFRNLPMPK